MASSDDNRLFHHKNHINFSLPPLAAAAAAGRGRLAVGTSWQSVSVIWLCHLVNWNVGTYLPTTMNVPFQSGVVTTSSLTAHSPHGSSFFVPLKSITRMWGLHCSRLQFSKLVNSRSRIMENLLYGKPVSNQRSCDRRRVCSLAIRLSASKPSDVSK